MSLMPITNTKTYQYYHDYREFRDFRKMSIRYA